MNTILKILILEDNQEDAALLERVLNKANIRFKPLLAITEGQFIMALNTFKPDLILADNSLPQFTATEALQILSKQSLHIPFILVTGTTSEEFAVNIIKLGADDYILKDRLSRLPAAIEATLKQHRAETEKQIAINKLVQNEERFRLTLDNMLEGIQIIGFDWKFIYVNDAMAIHGRKNRTDLPGKTLMEAYPGIESTPIFKVYKSCLVNRVAEHLEYEYIFADNSSSWFELSFRPVPEGMFILSIDISERKKTEAQLSEERNKFIKITQTSPGLIYSFHTNKDRSYFSFPYANDYRENIFGLTNSVLENDANVLLNHIHPEDQQTISESIIHSADKGTAWKQEFRYLHPTHGMIWLEGHSIPSFEQDGSYVWHGIVQDISDRKKAAEKLLNEKDLSDSIINNLPGIFYLYDKEGQFIRWNKNFESITGYSAREIEKMRPEDFYPTQFKNTLNKRIAAVFKDSQSGIEAPLLTKNNVTIPFYFNSIAINFEGRPCILGMGIDISEQKRAEMAIRELASHLQDIREEERAVMAREIHDELGQQITGLKMDISWISKKLSSEPPGIKNKIKDVLDLLDGTISAIRKIATALRPSILDDLGLIEAMEWQSQDFQKRSGIATHFYAPVADINTTGNIAIGLFRIYQESLTNIARHAAASVVTTKLEKKSGRLVLSIVDNGKGFDASVSINKKTLGLLGMKERTLMMGGECQIISHPGKGTKVVVEVPM
jgi:PAS domain S-box-containing protein